MPFPLIFAAPMLLSGGFAAAGIGSTVRAYKDNKATDLANWKANYLAEYSEEMFEKEKQQCLDALREFDGQKKDVFINCIIQYINMLSSIHNIEFDTAGLAMNDSTYFHIDQKKLGELNDVKVMGGGTAVATALFGSIGTPALLIASAILSGKAKENKAKADANLAQVDVYYEETKTLRVMCAAIYTRVSIFRRLLVRLTLLLQKQMVALHDVISDSGHDYVLYSNKQKKVVAMGISTLAAIKALMEEHLLDKEGRLTTRSAEIAKEIEADFFATDESDESSEVQEKEEKVNLSAEMKAAFDAPLENEMSGESEATVEHSIKLEDYIIYSDIEVPFGEILTLKNKKIYLNADIFCYGTLKLQNCYFIYSPYSNSASSFIKHQIILKEGASLFASNSVFRCENAIKNDFKSFIYGNEAGSTVCFENSTFIDFGRFLELQYCKKYLMQHCVIYNCVDNFVSVHLDYNGEGLLQSSLICMNNMRPFNLPDGKRSSQLGCLFDFNSWGNERTQILNCKFVETENFRNAGPKSYEQNSIQYVRSCADSCAVEQCDFTGISGEVGCSYMADCTFTDCTNGVVANNFFQDDEKAGTEIKECLFKNCTNVVGLSVCTHLHHSQFVGCHGIFIYSDDLAGKATISDCEFINSKYSEADDRHCKTRVSKICIALNSDEEDGHTNIIENCLFDGIDLDDAVLIRYAWPWNRHRKPVIAINKCEFRNLKLSRSSGLYVCTETAEGILKIKSNTITTRQCKHATYKPVEGTGCATSYTEKTCDSRTGVPIHSELSDEKIVGSITQAGYIGVDAAMGAASHINPLAL